MTLDDQQNATNMSDSKGLSMEWCKKSDSGLIKPDAVIYMVLSDEAMSQRQGFGDEVYESLDFQSKVKVNYDKLMDDSWIVVNTDIPREELHEKLMEIINETIEKSCHKPIEYLWME